MIHIPTLFILGAGASKPYGFSVGTELRRRIIEDFPVTIESLSDFPLLREREKIEIIRNAKKLVENFSESPVESIDRYLAFNPLCSFIGKIAITLYIRREERASRFLEQMDDPQEDWYKLIFNRMISDYREPQDYKRFRENKVAFVTFNYDRSLEYFLYTSFCKTFWESRNDFSDTLSEHIPFPIVHVYGQVGPTDHWFFDPIYYGFKEDYREAEESFKKIKEFSQGIRVIDERTEEALTSKIHALLAAYKRIFFCGFGYAKENFDAIDIIRNINEKTRVYGTAKGMTAKEIKNISKRFPTVEQDTYVLEDGEVIDTSNRAIIEDKNCYQLLREYL